MIVWHKIRAVGRVRNWPLQSQKWILQRGFHQLAKALYPLLRGGGSADQADVTLS